MLIGLYPFGCKDSFFLRLLGPKTMLYKAIWAVLSLGVLFRVAEFKA